MKTEWIFPLINILCSDSLRQYRAEEQAIVSNFQIFIAVGLQYWAVSYSAYEGCII